MFNEKPRTVYEFLEIFTTLESKLSTFIVVKKILTVKLKLNRFLNFDEKPNLNIFLGYNANGISNFRKKTVEKL